MSQEAERIAAYCLHEPEHLSIGVGQVEHRLQLIRQWPIQTGSTVLEIGCGQGDCTVVLASIVGPTGHVTAIDPAALSYGSVSLLLLLLTWHFHRIAVHSRTSSGTPPSFVSGCSNNVQADGRGGVPIE